MHCKNLDRLKSINKKTMLKADFFRTDCYKARENAKIKKILYSQKNLYVVIIKYIFFFLFTNSRICIACLRSLCSCCHQCFQSLRFKCHKEGNKNMKFL